MSGYAIISEIPVRLLGRTLTDRWGSRITFRSTPLGVRIHATRDGSDFGASPGSTGYETRELAIAGAIRGLADQGKRYARKFGASASST